MFQLDTDTSEIFEKPRNFDVDRYMTARKLNESEWLARLSRITMVGC